GAWAARAAGVFVREDNLVAWLQRLVRHPSEQSSLHEKDPAIARFIRECAAPLLREIGASCRYDPMGNLIVEAGPRSEQSLLFVAYAMTHPRANMPDPLSGTAIETSRGPARRRRRAAAQTTAPAPPPGAPAQ